MKMSKRWLIIVALLAVLAFSFGVMGTVLPPLPESEPITPLAGEESESVGHFANPPTYDSGWVDIRDKQGQYFNLNHDLNTTQVFVDIAGKQMLDYTDGPVALTKTYGGIDDDSCYGMIQTSEDGGYALVGTTASFGAGGYDFWLVKVDSSGTHQWNKTYGGTGDDLAMSFLRTSDGGYLLAGSTTSVGAGGADFYLVRTDESGNLLWARPYGGLENDVARFVIQTSDGGYAVAGSTRSKGAGNNDFWLIKTDSFGNPHWDNVYGGIGFDAALSLAQTREGGYAIAGNTWSSGAGGADFLLVKANSAGTEQWNKTYGGTRDDVARSVIQTKDERFMLAGTTTSYGAGQDDFWLIETDAVGTMQWNKTYGGPQMDTFRALAETRDNGYVLTGFTNSSGAGGFDFWLVKTDLSGNMLWGETHGGASDDYGYAAVQTYDGGYALAGITLSYGAGGPDFLLIKKDTTIARQWSQKYGGINDDDLQVVVQTSDGGFALAGSTISYGAGSSDLWLVKTDAYGTVQWNRTFGGTDEDVAYSLVQTSDGGYAMAGYTGNFGAMFMDFWLVKTDGYGTIQWNRTSTRGGNDFARSVIQTSDGGYALAGYAFIGPIPIGNWDFCLVKIDSLGNVQWSQTYTGANHEYAYSVIQTSDGGYALAGYTEYSSNDHDFWLVKTDSSGNMQWSQTYGGVERVDDAYSLVQTSDGGYAIAGCTHSFGAGNFDFWLVKTDSVGTRLWNLTYGGANDELACSLAQTSDGGFALAGSTESYGAGGSDFWLVKIDSAGTMLWSKTFGGSEDEVTYSVTQTDDLGYAIVGTTKSFGASGFDAWLVRVNGEMNTQHQKHFAGTGVIPSWSKMHWKVSWDEAWSMSKTGDGGYVLVGISDAFGGMGRDVLLVKTDGSGSVQWTKTYGWAQADEASSVIQTADGGYAIGGNAYSFGAGGSDAWLIKTDSNGNMQWNKTYGGSGGDCAWSVVQTLDGGYALAGWTDSFGAGNIDFYLVKTNSSGGILWNKAYGGSNNDRGWSLVQTADGGYAMAGHTWSFGAGEADVWLVRTDSSGNMLWNQTYGGTKWDGLWGKGSVAATTDGGYVMSCLTGSFGAGNDDFWLVKTDPYGNLQWHRTYGGTGKDIAFCGVQTADGGYALAGQTNSSGSGGEDFLLVKTDSAGNPQWTKTYGGIHNDAAWAVVQTDDGGYALAGYTWSSGSGSADFWLVKTDTERGLARTSLTEGTIVLYRGKTDLDWNNVRVRIWTIKEPSWIYGDLNMDGVVDAKDLYILGRNYGKTFSLLSFSGMIAVASIHTYKTRKKPKPAHNQSAPPEST